MLMTAVTLLSLISAVLAGISAGGIRWLWVAPLTFLGSFAGIFLVICLVVIGMSLLVDPKKPQEKDNKFYRFVINLMAEAAFPILGAKLHVTGREKMPKDGRMLVVCNHTDYMDPVALLAAFPKKELAFISKRENDRLFVVGPMMHKIMCQPINRENDREALRTILKCIDMLQKDQVSVAVFPEGYAHHDGQLRHFRHGVFKIAQRTKVPIVVCTIRNSQFVFHNAIRSRNTQVYLNLADVVQPQDYEGLTTVELGEKIYDIMAKDLGPDLVYQGAENT